MNKIKNVLLASTIASFVASAGSTGDTQSIDQINFAYAGDDSRLGIGITDEGELLGDFLKSFNSTYRSNWIAQGWLSDGAGGLELDYHWITTDSESDLIDNAADYKVNKLFIAIDQNTFDDRKITIGGGKENLDKFWSLNVSKAVTGTRLVSDTSVFTTDTINGFLGTHATTQLRTIEDITRIYEHPYDWGVGGRLGKYFDSNLVRLTGGLDYETGDYSSHQITASIDVEKYFSNTGHSVALHLEGLKKNGDFVIDKSDTRAFLMYRYDFGKTFKPTEQFEEVKVVDEDALARLKEERRMVIQNEIDLSSTAFFNLDSSELRDDTRSMLADVVIKIKAEKLGSKINIIGHTCSIGTDDYNQVLSEARAKTAHDFFIANGIDSSLILSSGKGESEPFYDNNGPDQPKNRRVAVSFLTLESNYREAEIPAEDVPVKWVKQPIKTAPSWLARALKNPAKHKRTVDVYQYQEEESITTLGAVVVLNQAPVASNDDLTVFRNSGGTLIDVLNNDYDGENDTITIIDVVQPSNGSVVNNGTSVTYTPVVGFIGTDTFEYTIDDGNGDQASAQVTINVLNNAPLANNDNFSVTRNSANTLINVLGNDTDVENEALTIVDFTQPGNGIVINNGTTVTYTPNTGFIGTDTFEYTIDDGNGDQATATVTITVINNAPEANDDSVIANGNEPLIIDVLNNDTDSDGTILNVTSVSQGVYGSVSINSDGTVTYQANIGYVGSDSFTYTVTDEDGGQSTANVNITVQQFNLAPIAVDDVYMVPLNSPFDFNPLNNDSDPDGDTITILSVDTSTLSGSLTYSPDGTMHYQPGLFFIGNDIFTYTISDGKGGTATATVMLCVAD